MFSTHTCPGGKSVFGCPFEEHAMPSEASCEGCANRCCDESDFMCDAVNPPERLRDMDECPEGDTEEVCSYGEHCSVGEPEDMIILDNR
jgi:hypothetical protein